MEQLKFLARPTKDRSSVAFNFPQLAYLRASQFVAYSQLNGKGQAVKYEIIDCSEKSSARSPNVWERWATSQITSSRNNWVWENVLLGAAQSAEAHSKRPKPSVNRGKLRNDATSLEIPPIRILCYRIHMQTKFGSWNSNLTMERHGEYSGSFQISSRSSFHWAAGVCVCAWNTSN